MIIILLSLLKTIIITQGKKAKSTTIDSVFIGVIIRVVKASNGAIVGLVALITQLPIYSATAAAGLV